MAICDETAWMLRCHASMGCIFGQNSADMTHTLVYYPKHNSLSHIPNIPLESYENEDFKIYNLDGGCAVHFFYIGQRNSHVSFGNFISFRMWDLSNVFLRPSYSPWLHDHNFIWLRDAQLNALTITSKMF